MTLIQMICKLYQILKEGDLTTFYIFRWFFGKFKISKRHSEINWPLRSKNGVHTSTGRRNRASQSALELAPIFKILTSCDNGEGLFVCHFLEGWPGRINSGIPTYLLENDDVITQQKRNTQMGPMNDEMVVCK